MPSLEFQVWCTCGEGLCQQTTVKRDRVTVEPCQKCLDIARSEGEDSRDEEILRLDDRVAELEEEIERVKSALEE